MLKRFSLTTSCQAFPFLGKRVLQGLNRYDWLAAKAVAATLYMVHPMSVLYNRVSKERSMSRSSSKGSERLLSDFNQILSKAIQEGILTTESHVLYKNTSINMKSCAQQEKNFEIEKFKKMESLQYIIAKFEDWKEKSTCQFLENCTFSLLFSEPNTQVWKMTNNNELLGYFTLKKSDYMPSQDKKEIISLFDESSVCIWVALTKVTNPKHYCHT